MRTPDRLACSLVAAACLLLPSPASADPVVGQIDDFEDGTTQGWLINLLGMGSPPAEALPTNVTTGGPGGLDDNYLRLTSLGVAGAGGRLVALNLDPRWTGDYLSSGVAAITMDLINLGSTDLSLRLLFEHVEAGPPTDVAFTTDAVFLAAGGGWTSATFRVGLDDLTAALGSVEAALGDVSVVRLYHSPAAGFPGPPTAAQLGVDNIRATAVPEPASIAMLLAGVLGAGLAAGRRGS
ncbi:PEP-CTERM sorting domain-containing protein [Paludisphaera soli]|uniref:PEP-CTERM sorting domain-containing protein n=1 Tax=Paludisphaera soli TaxID=2712865 RepID=UPI0013EDF92F|nr:PEP-CTERM sorting domain-containing protein [Paludisphaera soli]